MTQPFPTPVVFLTFANAAEQDYLQHLKQESAGLRDLLLPLDQAGRIDLLREESTDIRDIAGLLTQYKDRVAVFHYGGHADGRQLILEDAGGQSQGLTGLLALQRRLRLIFLNGCATRTQAIEYAEATGAAVVATTRAIPDQEATRFALAFYSALAQRHTLQEAFRSATAALQFGSRRYRHQSPEPILVYRGFHLDSSAENEEPAWDLFVREENRAVLDWSIPVEARQLQEKLVVVLANSESYRQLETRIDDLQHKIEDKQRQLDAFPSPLPEALQTVKDNIYQEWLSLNADLDKAKTEKEVFRQEILRLAETFNRVELPTEMLQQAKTLFEAGRFAEAEAALNNRHMQDRQQQLLDIKNRLSRELDKIDRQLRTNADEFLIKAQLALTRAGHTPDWEAEAAALFEQSLQSLPYFDNMLLYSLFLQQHKQFADAGARYRQLLQQPLALPERALILNNLGELYREGGAFAEAQDCFTEALPLYRRLAEANAAFLPALAQTLNNTGLLEKSLLNFSEAHHHLEESLNIHSQLAEAAADRVSPDVARTLNNLGELHREAQDFTGARQYFDTALDHYRLLVDHDAAAHEPMLARCLNNQGLLFATAGRIDEARARYAEALDIARRLVRSDPRAYGPDLAKMQNNLGELLRETQQFAEARRQFEEALQISRRLAAQDPTAFLDDVARTLNNLGLLDYAQQRYADAQSHLEEALHYYNQLETTGAAAYRLDSSRVRNNLAELLRNTGRPDQAVDYLRQAIDDCRRLTAYHAAVFLLTKMLNNLGTAFSDQGKPGEALPAFEEAEAMYRQAGADRSEALLPDFATTLNNLGNLYLLTGNLETAQARLEEALRLQTPQAEAHPQAFLPNYTFTLLSLAAFYRNGRPDPERSRHYAETAIARAQPYAKESPTAREYLALARKLSAK